MSSISHSMTTTRMAGAALRRFADDDAHDVGRAVEIAIARAVADAVDAHRRHRTKRVGITGEHERARRRQQLRRDRAANRLARCRGGAASPAPARDTGRARS